MANSNLLVTFIKIIVLTTALFGSLVAQSYATNLIADSITEMSFEETAKPSKELAPKSTEVNVL